MVGSDGQTYTAPTLVAHYVAAHGYAPPEPFVDGALHRAKRIRILQGDAVRRLRAFSVAERFALCLEALLAFQAQHHDDWLTEVITATRAMAPELVPRRVAAGDAEWDRLWKLLHSSERDDPIAVAAQQLGGFFAHLRMGESDVNAATLRSSIAVLEQTHDAGLVSWREDFTPSRWDEKS